MNAVPRAAFVAQSFQCECCGTIRTGDQLVVTAHYDPRAGGRGTALTIADLPQVAQIDRDYCWCPCDGQVAAV